MNESRLKNAIVLRMVIVGCLSLILLIPTIFIDSLIDERQERRQSATTEVSQGWGGAQTLVGPIITVPYKTYYKNDKGDMLHSINHAHFLPSELNIRAAVQPEIRYRGIYEVALYQGQFLVEGKFDNIDFERFGVAPENVVWRDAIVSFGVSDLKGIRDTVVLKWNQRSYPLTPGVIADGLMKSGMTFRPLVQASLSEMSFSLPVNLNGTAEISFVPVGEITHVFMGSSWSDPSFVGGFLPTVREVGANGFKAEWKVLSLNRNFPQAWVGDGHNLQESSFGTRLLLPVDHYRKSERTVKYALLFIALTFASLFLSEMMTKTAIHPIQYTLIGFALILFYLLLLSLSEHIGFDTAYGVSALLVIGLISFYTKWITAKARVAVVVFFVLMVLYLFLYVTLQLQDYALLFGTLGLLLTLFLIMYITRHVDWFSPESIT
ncbi:MAG: cell envelope integrity protein CreD [Ignavibacteriae bacterium]|nr:cell envelope integrity protein CreD [Ignavibacteriota bacterium]